MEEAGVKLIAEGANVYIGDLRSAESATNSFVDATEKGGGRVSGAGQVMIGALREVGAIATQAFMEAGRATAGFIKDSIGLAGDFDQGMREFQSAAGRDVDTTGLEQFRKLFIQIGKDLPVSTSDVQEAAAEMVKGGIDPAIVAAGGLKQNIQFAAAAMKGDLAGAAEISAKVLGGWMSATATAAEQAAFLTHSTDLLTKAANASSVDVKELASGLFNAQGIAKVAGVSFDDLTTTLAELAPRFASSSEAGTSLKNMIARLQPTTKPAIAAMKGLGLITADGTNRFYDQAGAFVGFEKASQLLQDSLSGLTKQQQASLLQTIFGNDAMGSAAGLAELGAKGYATMAEKMEKANGVAAAAALIQGSFNTKLDNAKGSIEALQITIGSALLPVLGDLLDNRITPAINAVTNFADRILGASDPMLAFASAIHGWSAPLGSIVFYLTELVRDGEEVNAWLKETPSLFQGLVGGVKGAIAEFSRLSDAFDTGGLSGVIDTLKEDISAALPGIKASLGAWAHALGEWALDAIPELLDNFAETRGKMMAWVADSLPEWGNKLAEFAEPAAEWVLDAIPDLLNNLGEFAKKMIDQTLTYLPRWGATFVEFGVKAVSWIGEQLPRLGDELGKFYNGMANWVVDSLPKWGSELKAFGATSVKWILDALPDLGTNLGKYTGNMLAWIVQTIIDVTPKLAEMGLAFVKWVALDVIPALPGALLTIATALYNFISEVGVAVVPKLAAMAEAFTGWVTKDVLPKLPGVLKSIQDGINAWSLEAARWALNTMVDLGKSIVQGIQRGLENAWGSLVDWLVGKMKSLFDSAMDTAGAASPAKEWMPLGNFMVQGIMEGFSGMWPALTKLVEGLGDELIDKARSIGESVQGAIADAFGATASIDRQIADNLDALQDVLPDYQQYTQGALKAAEQQARAFLDPEEGAKFFKMRSDQILEFADLQAELDKAQDSEERARIRQKMLLINDAQQKEIDAFNANLGATLSGTEQLMADIQQLLATKVKTKDAKGKEVEVGLPAITEDPTIRAFDAWLRQMMGYDPFAAWSSPAMAPSQPMSPSQQAMARATTVTNDNSRTVPMTVYTNMTPEAMRQSMAIAASMLP